MGVEDFQTVLICDNDRHDFITIVEAIKSMPKASTDKKSKRLSEEEYFLVEDDDHLIEVEISDNKKKKLVKVSCRFALCLPNSIDNIFCKFIREIGQQFKMIIKILDDVPKGFSDIFNPSEYVGLEDSLKKAIQIKRDYWIQDFGSETANLRPSDALRRFVLNES